MECISIGGKKKKQFDTLKEAIAEAKRVNALPQTITKKVAYKCTKCFKYHIGSNGKILKNKINIYENEN